MSHAVYRESHVVMHNLTFTVCAHKTCMGNNCHESCIILWKSCCAAQHDLYSVCTYAMHGWWDFVSVDHSTCSNKLWMLRKTWVTLTKTNWTVRDWSTLFHLTNSAQLEVRNSLPSFLGLIFPFISIRKVSQLLPLPALNYIFAHVVIYTGNEAVFLENQCFITKVFFSCIEQLTSGFKLKQYM